MGRLLDRLEERGLVVVVAGRNQYRCPAHDDNTPSLTVSKAGDGKVLLKCQAGCDTEDVVRALGLEMRDLFPVNGTTRGNAKRWTTEELKSKCTPPYPAMYTDELGEPLFLVARFDVPGEKKRYAQFRPDGRGRWIKGLDTGTRKPLFRLPALLKAIEDGATIHVVEGEKCVAALDALGLVATTNPGGKEKWLREYTLLLIRAKRIVAWADNDEGGRRHAYEVCESLLWAGVKDLRLVELPGPAKYDVADWLGERPGREAARAEVAALVESTAPYRPATGPSPKEEPEGRPRIALGTELQESGDLALRALAARPDVGLFVRGGYLVRIVRDPGSSLTGLQRSPEAPTIRRAEADTLRELLSVVARFEKWDGRAESLKVVPPPMDLAKALVARGEWAGIPVLEGFVESPILLPDGSLLETPGHDAATGIFYEPYGPPLPVVELGRDLRETAARSAAALLAPFEGYRFADPKTSTAALLAAILTTSGRNLIDGNVPIFAISAPKARSGKGKLCTAVGLIATGREPAAFSGSKEKAEYDKLFSAIAQEGDRVVVLDNIVGTFRSPELAYAVTSRTYRVREFGQNKRTLRAPWVATVLLNGNGLRLASDLSFRTIPIMIDFAVERPDLLRFDFDVVERVRAERPALYAHALAILRAYIAAGKPAVLERWSDFSEWDAWVRQPIAWLGLGDCRAGREQVIEEADDDIELARIVFAAWREAFPDDVATVPDAVHRAVGGEFATADRTLRDALEEIDPKLNARRIGSYLASHKNAIVGGLKLTAAPKTRHGYVQWRVVPVEPRSGGGEP